MTTEYTLEQMDDQKLAAQYAIRKALESGDGKMLRAIKTLMTVAAPEGALPPKVWAILKGYSHEGDALVAIMGSKKEADDMAQRMRDDDQSADVIAVQEWSIGEVNPMDLPESAPQPRDLSEDK